jgi:hypothetical protein
MFSFAKKNLITAAIIVIAGYFCGRLAYGGFTYSEEPSPNIESTKDVLRSNGFGVISGAHISQIDDLRRFPKLPPLGIPKEPEVAFRSSMYGQLFLEDVGAIEEHQRNANKVMDAERAKSGPIRPLNSYDFERYWSNYSPIIATHYRYTKGRPRMPSHHVGEIRLDRRKESYLWDLRSANEAWERAVSVERLGLSSPGAIFYMWSNSQDAAHVTLVADLAVQGVFISVRFNDLSRQDASSRVAKLVELKGLLGDKPAPGSSVVIWLTGAFVPMCDCLHFMLFLALIYLACIRWFKE